MSRNPTGRAHMKEGEEPGPGGKCDEGLVVSKKTGKCAVPKKKAE